MSPATKQTNIATPVKYNVNQIPKTPSLAFHDDFDLTPNTQTTHSFADSGFFSTDDGTYGAATGYKDWILFPDVDGVAETKFLDTSEFFKDADEAVKYSENHDELAHSSPSPCMSPSSSLELPPLNESYNRSYAHELRTLTQSLGSHYISSPSTPARSPSQPTFSALSNEDHNVSMLDIWQQSLERSERIAYEYEQPPHAQRENLLPVFKQPSRVRRRSGNASASRNRRVVGL